jgi:conjugative transposon TraN protein
MKSLKNITGLIIAIALTPFSMSAQNVYVNQLDITENKTTSILFPHPIEAIDLGSPNVLAQRVPGTENVLQIKADTSVFDETNLTVITSGGSLHQFNVSYKQSPATCYFIISKSGVLETVQSVIFNETNPVSFFEKAYKSIRSQNGKVSKERVGKVKAVLQGIYVKDNNLFFSVSVQNNSNIAYDIESVAFVVKDRKQAKRTAVQENVIVPIHSSSAPKTIRGESSIHVIYTLEKFTLPTTKQLHIVLTEKNGGRHITLKVDSSDINNSQSVSIK